MSLVQAVDPWVHHMHYHIYTSSNNHDIPHAEHHFKVSPTLLYKMKDEELFLKIVKASFSQRRKTIQNSLKAFDDIRDALEKAGISPGIRPEKLSIEDFIRIADALVI